MTHPEGFRAGDRHGWLNTWVSLMERVAAGRAAERLLDSGSFDDSGSVVVFPQWMWRVPGRKADGGSFVGSKSAVRRSTSRLLLPIPVAWVGADAVVVVDDLHPFSAEWSLDGLGVCESGIVFGSDFSRVSLTDEAGLVRQGVPEVLAGGGVADCLSALISDGKVAFWEALSILETMFVRAIDRSHWLLSKEISGSDGTKPLLDAMDLEKVRDELMFGSDQTRHGVSAAFRLVEKCVSETSVFNRVDPQMFLLVACRRDAMRWVRRAAGDPTAGSVIRAVARDLGTDDLVRIVAAYRERYPGDRLGVERVRRALSLGSSLVADGVSYSDWGDLGCLPEAV